MRTVLRSKFRLLSIVFGLLLAVPAVAFAADTLLADAHTLTGIQSSKNLGTVAPDAPVNASVDFYL